MAKKASRRDDDVDDLGDEDVPAGSPADATAGLAAIAVVLAIAAGVLFYLDTDAIGAVKITGPAVQVTAAVPAPAPAK